MQMFEKRTEISAILNEFNGSPKKLTIDKLQLYIDLMSSGNNLQDISYLCDIFY